MLVIQTRNVHEALPEALDQLRILGVRRDSRNGPVVMFPEPVTTVYRKPAERVLFWAQRDANPFFHLIESLWMLAGRNDVQTVAHYVTRMRSFSDDGKTFHGAYGHRWRWQFGFDQLPRIITNLRSNKDDRRQVLSMWSAEADLGQQDLGYTPKDLPCNLQAIFQIACDGRLDMMVTNRSNDIIWGAYGANAVHFSYLHEYVARLVGVEQGVYRQVSANFHAYQEVLEKNIHLADLVQDRLHLPANLRWVGSDPYVDGKIEPFPLMSVSPEDWHMDLNMFFRVPEAMGYRDPFFRRVVIPMVKAHRAFKAPSPERFDLALYELTNVAATDWKLAAMEWIERRRTVYLKARDDGVSYE